MVLSLPYYLLFIPYGIFVLVFGFYSFFNLFQLYKYGVNNTHTRIILYGFVALTLMVFVITFLAALNIPWTNTVTFDSGNMY